MRVESLASSQCPAGILCHGSSPATTGLKDPRPAYALCWLCIDCFVCFQVVFYVFKRQSDREAEGDLPWTGSLPQMAVVAGLVQAISRSLDLPPGLPGSRDMSHAFLPSEAQ